MKRLAQGQESGHCDGAGGSNGDLAKYGIGTESESQHSGDNRGDAVTLLGARFHPIEGGEDRGKGHEHQSENGRIGSFCNDATYTAEQPDECKGSNPGGSLEILRITATPAPLEADQKADRQGNAKPAQQFKFCHFAVAPRPVVLNTRRIADLR